jgi:2-oxoglutarate dehydrogenase E2 component (dihydrolipoamide succinyltransferase)
VTRWLKKEGDHVEVDEPLLEVSTDKVDTEIPSPASGILRGITVAEDETVAVGAQLATIEEAEEPGQADGGGQPAEPGQPAQEGAGAEAAQPAGASPDAAVPEGAGPQAAPPEGASPEADSYPYSQPPQPTQPAEPQQPAQPAPPQPQQPRQAHGQPQPQQGQPQPQQAQAPPQQGQAPPQQGQAPPQPAAPEYGGQDEYPPAAAYPPAYAATAPPAAAVPPRAVPPPAPAPEHAQPYQTVPGQASPPAGFGTAPGQAPTPPPAAAAPRPPGSDLTGAEGPYVTPLVRKLAAEHGVNLAAVSGTGVGGRIRKQDVLEAARAQREQQAAAPAAVDGQSARTVGAPGTAQVPGAAAPARTIVPSTLRGTTERMSRARQLIARRMVESLQTSAQLTTVVEADVTAIARLRERAKTDFEAREGVRLSFLPFFALAAVEALKVHPKLNALIDTDAGQITYLDAEHLGIAVDTERGLMVPVIRNAGDLNIGGLARKIADLAARTRAGQVSPDELAGGTFTLTNTGSRGALFDTPIINQPQVGILGTGSVVKRPVVMEDPALGEVIAVRSMVYLALTYDHRLVDGADAARFLATVKDRLEEGAFETELGL